MRIPYAKLIGSGLQYDVYDIGGNRVRKVPHSIHHACRKALRTRKFSSYFKMLATHIKLRERARKSLRGLKVRWHRLDPAMMGNPIFLNGLTYEQDTVVVLDKVFSDGSVNLHAIVDRYIDHVLSTWSFGFSEITYNFTLNHGINSAGRIVLVDLGEVTFSKSNIAAGLVKNEWMRSWSFKCLRSDRLKEYYASQCTKRLNLKALETMWLSQRTD